MKATVLVDNISFNDIPGEWGLCFFIEYGDKKILLDAGASDLFRRNADKLGIDLTQVDFGALSHGHWDHANGIPEFFEVNGKAPFYIQQMCGENCYKRAFFYDKYIGIPKGMLKKYPDRINKVSGDYQVCEGVYIIPHKTQGLDQVGKREAMYQRKGFMKYAYDDFSHEQSLVFDTEEGLVIFNCCSHGGAANIIREVQASFPDKKVRAMIGGFHLFNKSADEVRALAAQIKETGISYVCTGHCTGDDSYAVLKEELGDICHQLHTGLVIEF